MGEDVSYGPGLAMPARNTFQVRRLSQRRFVILFGAPFRTWHLRHATEQPLFRAAANQKLVATRHDEGRATTQGPGLLRELARKAFLRGLRAGGAILVQGTERAGRLLRRADGCAKVHQRLRAV